MKNTKQYDFENSYKLPEILISHSQIQRLMFVSNLEMLHLGHF